MTDTSTDELSKRLDDALASGSPVATLRREDVIDMRRRLEAAEAEVERLMARADVDTAGIAAQDAHIERLQADADRRVAEEREACATIAETCEGDFERDTAGRTEGLTRRGIASAIRARSNGGHASGASCRCCGSGEDQNHLNDPGPCPDCTDNGDQVSGVDTRSCTCHPDDNPPRPCPRKFAYSDCVAAAAAPDGWKLVPVEPTEEMCRAGVKANDDADQEDRIWAAMLAAAPTPLSPGASSVDASSPSGSQAISFGDEVKFREALTHAVAIIEQHVPPNALGRTGGDDDAEWPIRDEYLHSMRCLLEGHPRCDPFPPVSREQGSIAPETLSEGDEP